MVVFRIVPNSKSNDPASSKQFYEDLFGLDVVMDQGWIVTLAEAAGNSKPEISLISVDATAPVVADISIEVDDVDAVHAVAASRGHQVIYPLTNEPWGVRRFFVKDPDGTVLNVLSHLG